MLTSRKLMSRDPREIITYLEIWQNAGVVKKSVNMHRDQEVVPSPRQESAAWHCA
jgi:hypothetical protein